MDDKQLAAIIERNENPESCREWRNDRWRPCAVPKCIHVRADMGALIAEVQRLRVAEVARPVEAPPDGFWAAFRRNYALSRRVVWSFPWRRFLALLGMILLLGGVIAVGEVTAAFHNHAKIQE